MMALQPKKCKSQQKNNRNIYLALEIISKYKSAKRLKSRKFGRTEGRVIRVQGQKKKEVRPYLTLLHM